jgi:hypothetical protein
MLSEIPMGIVVIAPHRRLLERAVHPLHLAVIQAAREFGVTITREFQMFVDEVIG